MTLESMCAQVVSSVACHQSEESPVSSHLKKKNLPTTHPVGIHFPPPFLSSHIHTDKSWTRPRNRRETDVVSVGSFVSQFRPRCVRVCVCVSTVLSVCVWIFFFSRPVWHHQVPDSPHTHRNNLFKLADHFLPVDFCFDSEISVSFSHFRRFSGECWMHLLVFAMAEVMQLQCEWWVSFEYPLPPTPDPHYTHSSSDYHLITSRDALPRLVYRRLLIWTLQNQLPDKSWGKLETT